MALSESAIYSISIAGIIHLYITTKRKREQERTMGAASSSSTTSVTESSTTSDAKVTGLFIYPVKSCRGIPLSNAPLTPSGTTYIASYFIYFGNLGIWSKDRLIRRVQSKCLLDRISMGSTVDGCEFKREGMHYKS